MLKVQSMGKAQKFEDLEIFQSARNLSKEVYAITKEGEFSRDSRFVQQIHASSGSVMDNIAEGFEREGNKEFVNFLYIAKGSCGEVRSQIIRASGVGFIDNETATRLYNDCIGLSKAISAFIKTLKDSGFAGSKFNRPSGSSKFNDLEP